MPPLCVVDKSGVKKSQPFCILGFVFCKIASKVLTICTDDKSEIKKTTFDDMSEKACATSTN